MRAGAGQTPESSLAGTTRSIGCDGHRKFSTTIDPAFCDSKPAQFAFDFPEPGALTLPTEAHLTRHGAPHRPIKFGIAAQLNLEIAVTARIEFELRARCILNSARKAIIATAEIKLRFQAHRVCLRRLLKAPACGDPHMYPVCIHGIGKPGVV
jgi:hypothetical protein